MKLKLNYRNRRFTPAVRTASIEKQDSILHGLRKAVEAEFADLSSQRGHLVRLSLNEAEALALQTAYPQLVFPALAQEKLSALKVWHQRQTAIWGDEAAVSFAA
jgi:hypothetical protein